MSQKWWLHDIRVERCTIDHQGPEAARHLRTRIKWMVLASRKVYISGMELEMELEFTELGSLKLDAVRKIAGSSCCKKRFTELLFQILNRFPNTRNDLAAAGILSYALRSSLFSSVVIKSSVTLPCLVSDLRRLLPSRLPLSLAAASSNSPMVDLPSGVHTSEAPVTTVSRRPSFVRRQVTQDTV